jgi:hypothetical protein
MPDSSSAVESRTAEPEPGLPQVSLSQIFSQAQPGLRNNSIFLTPQKNNAIRAIVAVSGTCSAALQQKGKVFMPKWLEIVRVQIPKAVIDRRDWVKYLVLVNWHAKQLGDVIERVPSAEFSKYLENQVQSYLKGTNPPAAIQSAIMNITDDYIAGREFTVKAGDYIALQNHFQSTQH